MSPRQPDGNSETPHLSQLQLGLRLTEMSVLASVCKTSVLIFAMKHVESEREKKANAGPAVAIRLVRLSHPEKNT